MKLNHLMLYIISFLIMIQYGCKKEEVNIINSVSYNGQDYALGKAYLNFAGMHPYYTSDYHYELVIYSKTLEVQQDDNSNSNLSGTGNFIYLSLIYADSLGLQLGEYLTYPENKRRIYSGFCGLNYNTDIGFGLLVEIDKMSISKLNVSLSNGIYDLDFELTGSNEKQLIGNFTGQITNLDILSRPRLQRGW